MTSKFHFAVKTPWRCVLFLAVIQFVQARMGVTPGWGGAMQLVDLVGKQEALKILVTSKKIQPTQALVDEIIPQDTVSSCYHCVLNFVSLMSIYGLKCFPTG
jgi:pentose-5-phosphate-3-epimerase